MADELLTITEDGRLQLFFHPGQLAAWQSPKRFVLVLGGAQSGKTVFGRHWIFARIQDGGPGDYMVVTPTFSLLEKKLLPEFLYLFMDLLRLGTYHSGRRQFTFSKKGSMLAFGRSSDQPTRVMFGYAAKPSSLESATVKAAWLDECGQEDFKQGAYEAILRRLSIFQGRLLLTTTPYYLNWIEHLLCRPWETSGRNHRDIDVISFPSTANPRFPVAEFERARATLPDWKFAMFYLGQFSKPAGLIFDCFSWATNVCARFAIPGDWPRCFGLDFGGVNTAGIGIAAAPDGRYFVYRIYKSPGLTAAEHVAAIRQSEPGHLQAVGGAGSEDQWRSEFAAAGLSVARPPISDVEVGIDRVYGAIKNGMLLFFDDLVDLLNEINNYSRVVDGDGNPTEVIQNKSSYHLIDALRYACSLLFHGAGDAESAVIAFPDPLENLTYAMA